MPGTAELETDETSLDDASDHAPAWMGAVAGGVAGGVSLALGELFDSMSIRVPSLVIAAGEWFRDAVPGDFAKTAIDIFGENDKPALVIGTTIVTLAIAAIVGVAALRRRWIGDIVFAAFAVIGGWLASDASQAESGPSWAAAIVAALAGWITLRLLLRLAEPESTPARFASQGGGMIDDPRDPEATRRAFLAFSGGAAVAAVGVAGIGRLARGPSAAEKARDDLVAAGGDASASVDAAVGSVDTLDEIADVSRYITPNDEFYLIDTALTKPQVDPATWRLRFTGMVDDPFEIGLDEILGMDLVEQTITLSCVSNEVGGNLVGNAVWTGVPLVDLVERAGVQDGATQLVGRSVDNWSAGFPTDVLYDGRNALLAVRMNGEPLPIRHGFPARLVVAGLYGYVSAVKWVEEIHLTRWEDFDGYWIPRGWSKLGPIKTQSRIDVPRRGDDLVAGATTPIAGVAWAPDTGIEAVEVQIDDGPWQQARIGGTASDDTWVQWVLDWGPIPGDHTIRCRATDKSGLTQRPDEVPPRPDGAEGYDSVRVSVDAV